MYAKIRKSVHRKGGGVEKINSKVYCFRMLKCQL